MHYLLTADVTAARRLMAMSPRTLSLTGFVAVAVARAAAEIPVVHSYRDWRGRLVSHRHVDVLVPIETQTEHGPRTVPHIVPNADTRDVAEVSKELLAAKETPAPGILEGLPRLAGIPGLVRAAYTALDRSVRLRQQIGTVMVATTGLRDIGEGFGVAAPSLMPLQVVIGSMCPQPHQTGNHIEQHEMLNLTLTFDGAIVGNSQASHFAMRLCAAIEHADALQPQPVAEHPVRGVL
jgi:pyruvate/2-oxoglutarate dehydrogenase complex dihydrolipoamide acyltransferase (E2) component